MSKLQPKLQNSEGGNDGEARIKVYLRKMADKVLDAKDELGKYLLEIDLMKLIRRMLCDDNEEDMHSGWVLAGVATCSCCGQYYTADNFYITKHPRLKTIYEVCSKCREKLNREAEPDKALDHMLLERMLEKLNKGTLGKVRDEESG